MIKLGIFFKNKGVTVAAIFVGIFLVALDQTIVVTALPSILVDLDGIAYFPWIFSSYMIAELAALPIFGKLSDRYGRKLFFLLGIIVFLLGSLFCAMATSMTSLIVARFIQGFGGGAIIPISFALLFNLSSVKKRYLMQGLLAAVFGLASISGPSFGGMISDYFDWHWVFLINIPVGVLICAFMISNLKLEFNKNNKLAIDCKGIALFLISIMSFLLGIELLSKFSVNYFWFFCLLTVSIISTFGFLYVERKAEDPVIPLYLFKETLFSCSQLTAFILGALMMAVIAFMPLFIQGVRGESAIEAGKVITPMMIGVVTGSILGGRLVEKLSFRNSTLLALFLSFTALIFLSGINYQTNKILIAAYMVTFGLGIGISFPVLITASLNRIDPDMHGIVNALAMFFRNLGSAIGVLAFGTLQLACLEQNIDIEAASGGQLSVTDDYRRFFQAETRSLISQDQIQAFVLALSKSVTQVYHYATFLCVIAFTFALAMGNERLLYKTPPE